MLTTFRDQCRSRPSLRARPLPTAAHRSAPPSPLAPPMALRSDASTTLNSACHGEGGAGQPPRVTGGSTTCCAGSKLGLPARQELSGTHPHQKFHYGDLVHCETTFKKMGRTAQVNIICGHCSNKACKDEQGCICSIAYDELMCRVNIELAMECAKSGPRIFKGFTLGLHPRSSEIVYNGLTQPGFEKLGHEFSFQTEQIHVSLYLSVMSSQSSLVGIPTFKVNPVKGLDVKLTGSAVYSAMPTTLSPTVLNVDWRCEIARSSPYEVNILIPVEGYDPIEFTLSKQCGHRQEKESDSMKGWATFGVFCCIFIVLSSLFCCGGFIYKSRMQNLYGLDALPGIAILSAFLDAVGRPGGYSLAGNPSESHASQASWENTHGTTQASQRSNDRTYGSI